MNCAETFTNSIELAPIRNNKIWSLLRSTPVTIPSILIIISILYPTVDNYIFLAFILGTHILNVILKGGFQLIYYILDTDYIPLIGQGTRPPGAHSCGSFISVPLIPATSFGMPSGHSQLAWFFTTYACLNIINSRFDYFQNLQIHWNSRLQLLSVSGLIIFASMISYSRVYIEQCHTIGQVIIGGITGIITGCIAFKFRKWLKKEKIL
jgi:membrane-associated phospholipid phosphatase